MFQCSMGFYEDLMSGIKKAIAEKYGGKLFRLAKKSETHPTTLTRIIEGDRQKWLLLISRVADSCDLKVVPSHRVKYSEENSIDENNLNKIKELEAALQVAERERLKLEGKIEVLQDIIENSISKPLIQEKDIVKNHHESSHEENRLIFQHKA